MVASVAMPGRNPDGSYGARPDSTVPHAISEPAALTAEQEEEMAAMAKWAKAEEGMRLVQELESHSAQRDDAIANLQNMLNGIGKPADVAEAAALAAAPPAPPAPPTGVQQAGPAVDVNLAANNIVPDMPTPVPVAAGPVAPPAPPPVATPPATPPEHASAATPPSTEGDAGALAALARGELPASFPPPTRTKKFVMRRFGDGVAPGPSDTVAPAAALSSPTSPATDVDGVSSEESQVVFYECSAWPRGEASEWPRVKGVTPEDGYPVPPAEDNAAMIDSLAAMKVAEAEAAIHAGRDGIPVVPVVDDPTQLERSDPFAAFLLHVDKVLERSENAGSFDEDDEIVHEIVVAPVDPIEEEARAFAASIAPPPPAPVVEDPEKLEEPDVESAPVVEEDVHAELKLARDRLEAAEAFAETLAHDMEQAYAEMAAAKQEAAAAKRLAESAASAESAADPARTARVSELLDELERWQLAAAAAEAALEEAKMELEVMTARAAEDEISDDANDDVIAELAAELQAAEAKAAKAETYADELDAHLQRLEEELAGAKNEAKAELERAKNDAKAELERAEAAVTELERELETAEAKVLETAVESEALAALTAELDEARAEAELAETEMDALKRATTAELDAARAEIADARAEIDAERAAKSALEKGLEEALADAEEEKARALAAVEAELQAAKARMASAELEKDGELAELRSGLEEARAFVAEKAAEITALKKEAAFNAQKAASASDDSALAAARDAEKAAETIQAAAEQLREAKANAADLAAQMEAKDEEITALRLECEDVKVQAMNAARDGRAKIDALEARAAALDACRETVEEVKMHAAAAALCAAVAMLPRMREAGIIHA